MKKISLKNVEIISFIIASILGVFFHFIYEWSNENPIAALFFPVNESTWEHLKLIFFPILLLSIAEYFLFGVQYKNFVFVKFLSAVIGMVITVVLFYTYTGVYGKNNDVINILIYFIAMILAYVFSYRSLRSKRFYGIPEQIGFYGFLLLFLMFVIFTLFPPEIELFLPPSA